MENLSNNNTPLMNNDFSAIDQGKDTDDLDEIFISKDICTLIGFFPAFFIPFFWPFILLFAYKFVVLLDSKKKKITVCHKNIFGCKVEGQKYYDYCQIKRIKLYVSSTRDRERPFDKLYYMNCDIFSVDGQQDSLFSAIKYDELQFNNFIKDFEKHLNIEVESIDDYKKNNNLNNITDNQITPNKNDN